MIKQELIETRIKKTHSETPRVFKVEFEDNDFVVGDIIKERDVLGAASFKITNEEGSIYTIELTEPEQVDTIGGMNKYNPRLSKNPYELVKASEINPRKEIKDPELSSYPLFRDRILVRPIENKESVWLYREEVPVQGTGKVESKVSYSSRPAWCKVLAIGPWVGKNKLQVDGEYDAPQVGDIAYVCPNRMEADVTIDGKPYPIFTEQSFILSYRENKKD